MSDSESKSTSIFSQFRKSLDETHQFIDQHPQAIKNCAYGVGALGVIILFKSLHVGKFIKHGSEIPKKYIKRGVHLQGSVKEIHSDGLLYVQHIPILDLRLPWLRTPRKELLPMTLAFVDLRSFESKQWLRENLLHKQVWFQVLKVDEENDYILHSAVFKQKFFFWKTCINEKLIEDGLCCVFAVPENEMKYLSLKETELLDRMIALEKKADKKGRGIWKETKPPFKQTVKKLLYVPVFIVQFLYEKSKGLLKRTKHVATHDTKQNATQNTKQNAPP